jgi:hypothetical protein
MEGTVRHPLEWTPSTGFGISNEPCGRFGPSSGPHHGSKKRTASHARRRFERRPVLAYPVLYRSGAPDTIRTCDLCLRRATVLRRQSWSDSFDQSQESGIASPRNHRYLRCRRRRSGRVAFRVLSAMKRSQCHKVSRQRAASNDLAILLATRCDVE